MNLSESLGEDGGAIKEMIAVQGKLFAIAENRIVQISTAETIDPENKNPETLHHHQIVHNVGSSDPTVSRKILQSKEIIGSVLLDNKIDKEKLIDQIWDCTVLLINCSQALRNIYSDVMELMTQCDELITEAKSKGTIPSLPQVDSLEERLVTYLGSAKRFLEKTHSLLCTFYGAPNSEANFKAYRDWIEKNAPAGSNIFNHIESYKDNIKEIAWARNALDVNHSYEGFRVELFNFKIQPGNRFGSPCIKYDFSAKGGAKTDDPVDLLEFLTFHTNELINLFEATFLEGITDCWDKRYNFVIYKVPDDQVCKERPILYRVTINSKSQKTEAEPGA